MYLVTTKNLRLEWLSLKDTANRERALKEARGLYEYVEAYISGNRSLYPQIEKGVHYLNVTYNMSFSYDPWTLYGQLKDFIAKLEKGETIVQGTEFEETKIINILLNVPKEIQAVTYSPETAPSKEKVLGLVGGTYTSNYLARYPHLANKPQQSNWWIYLLIGAVGVGVVMYFVMRRK